MDLLQNIKKESDPVRQTHYTTKRHWLVDFINIFSIFWNFFIVKCWNIVPTYTLYTGFGISSFHSFFVSTLFIWHYQKVEDEKFSDYRDKSVQDFRFALSEGIRQQVFFATFVKNIESLIKSSSVLS